jgi:DNA-binding transcriptional MerR regulator
MLTIGQLASYAGTTVRAVRHYHHKGLLSEPERDHSGYRRYDAAAVVELIRIRTLADAGVPLSRVRELLAASPDEFAAAVGAIDGRLRAEILELQEHRRRIARLAGGDSLALPPEAVAYLDHLRGLGFPDRMVNFERDAWILVAAQMPEQMPTMMALKRAQLDSPAVIDLYVDLLAAVDWEPDDPRVVALADRLVSLIETTSEDWADQEKEFALDDALVALLDAVFLDAVPIGYRLLELMEERGWTGWTRLERVDGSSRPATSDRP